jgi:putative aminopeptidase FrvX
MNAQQSITPDEDKRLVAESLQKWIRERGFEATINRAGNVMVTLQSRRVTRMEVMLSCHLKGEYLRQVKDGVVVKA